VKNEEKEGEIIQKRLKIIKEKKNEPTKK